MSSAGQKKKPKFVKVDPRCINIINRHLESSSSVPSTPCHGTFPELDKLNSVTCFDQSSIATEEAKSSEFQCSQSTQNQKSDHSASIEKVKPPNPYYYKQYNPNDNSPRVYLSWPSEGRGAYRGKRQVSFSSAHPLLHDYSAYELSEEELEFYEDCHLSGEESDHYSVCEASNEASTSGEENSDSTFGMQTLTLNTAAPVYPLPVVFDLNLEEMTSREMYDDIYADYKTHKFLYRHTGTFDWFRDAILSHAHLFKDKVILDVGCGLGLLSLFAAEAGARHVISVDCSVVTELTKRIVDKNGYGHVITVVRSRMEDMKSLPHNIEKVDVILSCWMGQCLFLDSVFDAVLYARDTFLKEDGVILPDKAKLWAVGACDEVMNKKCNFWFDVYGFDFDCVKGKWNTPGFHHHVRPSHLLTRPTLLHTIDLKTCNTNHCNFKEKFQLEASKYGNMNSVLIFFDVSFLKWDKFLDTAPGAANTQYGQTSLFFHNRTLSLNRGTIVYCYIEFSRMTDKKDVIECLLQTDAKTYNYDSYTKTFYITA